MSLTYGFNLGTTGATYTAEQLTDAIKPVVGDSVASYGSGFSLELNSLMSFTIGSGYLYANGNWYKYTGAQTFTLEAASATESRTDALAAVVDYDSRETRLELLTGVTSPTQDSTVYQVFLYTFAVAAGMVELLQSAVTDNRQTLYTLDEIYDPVNTVYEYINSGFETHIASVVNAASAAVTSAASYESQAKEIALAQQGLTIGDLRQAVNHPTPTDEWLQCNGSAISTAYATLRALVGSTTPVIAADDSRLTVWIYAGAPS